MKATLYLSMVFGSLLCHVVCGTRENKTLRSEITNDDNVPNLENKPLFYNDKYSSSGVDRHEILVEENGDSVLLFGVDSTLRSSSVLEESLEENGEAIVSTDDFETSEEDSETFNDKDNTDLLKQAITKTALRDFIKNQAKSIPKFNKYTRLNAVKEIFPLRKKSSHNDKISSEEVSEKDESNKGGSFDEVPNKEEWFSNENISSQAHGSILKSRANSTINHFLCRAENDKDSVVLHGARAWSFETQDVNLTLKYPLVQTHSLEKQYIITGFSVMLVTDGVDSRGYINGGGVLMDNLSLSFISPGISSLLYEFKVYGIPWYSVTNVDLLNTLYYLCS